MPSYLHRMPRSVIAQLFAGGPSLVSAGAAKALTLPIVGPQQFVSGLPKYCRTSAAAGSGDR